MMRLVLGVVCGLVVAFALVFATDALFHLAVPSAARPTDPAAMRDYTMRQPPAALLAIVAGWTVAVFAGAAAACRIARAGAGPGWAVTGLFALATAANFLMLPHPVWMIVMAAIAIAAAGWLATRLFAADTASTPAQA